VNAPSVILAAGGTGGHLFPALALAQELGRRAIVVDLMTDTRGDRYGSDFPARHIYRVPSATIGEGHGFLDKAKTALTLGRGILSAYRQLGSIKPGAVIGFGGYPSFPPLVAAFLRHIPTAIHEQNSVLGRANRMLASRVTAIATSFSALHHLDAALEAKVRLTGNPVRDAVIDRSSRAYAPPASGGTFTLLVFGGSQGARFFSDTVPAAIALLKPETRQRLRIVQQCREEDLGRVRQAYAALEVDMELASFFRDLPERMAAAHLVIGRAGASSVAELTVMGRPSILVPLPHAIDNDQLRNATQLAKSGGAICIEQKDLTPELLAREVERLSANPEALAAMAAAAKAQGRPDAVVRLADLIEELMGLRQPPRQPDERGKH
jgi:UDP-N-acetylglucosamine--N-acetylmuramyl-(pentapeptide) pyrophosphoryl-undecaprenol N-acetylglucosamine transferase